MNKNTRTDLFSVTELMEEKARLEDIVAQASVAKESIKLLNRLIAQYGSVEKAEGSNISPMLESVTCEHCGRKFASKQAKGSHQFKVHGIAGVSRRSKAGIAGVSRRSKAGKVVSA
jgi:hypothetical protein